MGKKIVWVLNRGNEPTPFLVESETKCFYHGKCNGFFKQEPIEKRITKKNTFKTFADARQSAMACIDREIGYLDANIQRKKSEKQKINNMKQPEIPKWMK